MAKKSKQKRERERQRRTVAAFDDAAAQMAALVGRTSELAMAMVDRCADGIEHAMADVTMARIGADTWRDADPARALVEVLDAFDAERKRHAEALVELHGRFVAIVRDESQYLELEDGDALHAELRAALIEGAARMAVGATASDPP